MQHPVAQMLGLKLNIAGWVIVAEAVTLHPFASVIVLVYVPGANAALFCVVMPPPQL